MTESEEAERAVLLDANLLLLLAVGRFDRSLVGRKRLDVYSASDFNLLARIISPFRRNLTTPHVLAEVGNLADQCVPKLRHRTFRRYFASLIAHLDERWTDAKTLCATDAFGRLGLTDAAVCDLAGQRTLVISTDANLCGLLWGKGVNVENFNHLRIR